MQRTQHAQLLYDSAKANACVGARSGICVDRTVLFRTPEFTVDLVIHASRQALRYLHGQVVSENGGQPVRGAFVQVDEDGAPVPTDEHGQFAVSSLTEHRRHVLRIRVLDQETVCVIPAPESLDEALAPQPLRGLEGTY